MNESVGHDSAGPFLNFLTRAAEASGWSDQPEPSARLVVKRPGWWSSVVHENTALQYHTSTVHRAYLQPDELALQHINGLGLALQLDLQRGHSVAGNWLEANGALQDLVGQQSGKGTKRVCGRHTIVNLLSIAPASAARTGAWELGPEKWLLLLQAEL